MLAIKRSFYERFIFYQFFGYFQSPLIHDSDRIIKRIWTTAINKYVDPIPGFGDR